jgi:transglutaminase-like putative cysteine protease
MRRLTIDHVTTYKYKKPVAFGRHRMMLRPRDSHDLRLLAAGLVIEPAPETLHWLHDVFGNSVAVASFTQEAAILTIASHLDLEEFVSPLPDCPIEAYAETFPFAYSAEEIPDLHRLIERQYPDEHHEVDLWARRFANRGGETNTLAMLTAMSQTIQSELCYAVRLEEGCQLPAETLERKSGSCRDFALLMMESVRALGLAARFVSGYVYVPSTDNGEGKLGGGASHGWLEVYLPGAGWLEFDPTNGLVGNRDLIRVAVARDPSQAIPVSGQWTGAPADFIGMEVNVSVTTLDRTTTKHEKEAVKSR